MVAQQLEASLQGSNHSIYVATANDEEIIGYVAVHWLPCLFLPGPEGYVSELFVVDSVRGQGIGKFLLDAAEEEANERGSPRL